MKCVSLKNRWKSIKKNAKRHVDKKVRECYNSQVGDVVKVIQNESVGTMLEKMQASEAIVQIYNEETPILLNDEENELEHNNELSIASTREIDNEVSENYVQELWDKVKSNWEIELDAENMPNIAREEILRESMLNKIKSWASNHSITHMAISDLMKVLNEEIPNINLPIDGRTVMETPRRIHIIDDAALGGKYWHYGLGLALSNALDV